MSLYKLLVQLLWELDTPTWYQVKLLGLDTSDQHVSELKNQLHINMKHNLYRTSNHTMLCEPFMNQFPCL